MSTAAATRTRRPAPAAGTGHGTDFARATFEAIGTHHEILCSDPASLPAALRIARGYLAELDSVASRFRDSELDRINRAARHADVDAPVSPLLETVLRAALDAAGATDGLNDPTVGASLVAAGYDLDLELVRARTDATASHRPDPTRPDSVDLLDAAGLWGEECATGAAGPYDTAGTPATRPAAARWRTVDLSAGRLRMPAGTLVDLGSIGKAHAADAIAAECAALFPGVIVVNCGGDIAVAGSGPAAAAGVPIGIRAADGTVLDTVLLHRGGIATSSTQLRRWTVDGRDRHHIIDPRTGESADPVWRTVTVTADSAAQANAASTAAVVLAHAAPDWLRRRGIPALLTPAAGPVVRIGWPAPCSPKEVAP